MLKKERGKVCVMSLKNLVKITGVGGAVYSALCLKRRQENTRCSALNQPSHKRGILQPNFLALPKLYTNVKDMSFKI